jgi:hypothetical protein
MRVNLLTAPDMIVIWAVTHQSTNRAQSCLTLEIKWVPVCQTCQDAVFTSPLVARIKVRDLKEYIKSQHQLTRSRCENCFAKSSNAIQNSPSFLTLAERSSLSLSESESHSQLRSLQGPFHSPLPQGLRSLTRCVSPGK